jgi:hypothetical protein
MAADNAADPIEANDIEYPSELTGGRLATPVGE